MEQLTRTKAAGFTIEESKTLAEIESLAKSDKLSHILIPIDTVFNKNVKAYVKPEFQKALQNGNHLPYDAFAQRGPMKEAGEAGDAFAQRGPMEEADDAFAQCVQTAEVWKTEQICVYDQEENFAGLYTWQEATNDFKVVKLFVEKEEQK
ncbi:hypothetical protein LQZ18_06350 [Lachnospiraceae bacterium ZAX-1]